LRDSLDLTAIVLAAGRSTRFGDRHKALPEPYGVGLLARAATIFKTLGLTKVLVVTGYRAEEVGAEAERYNLATVYNAAFDQGMYSSILTGLAAAGPSPVLVLPVDAAFVSPQSVLAVIGLWRGLSSSDREMALILPAAKGLLGHPPLLGSKVAQTIPTLKVDNLRRAFLTFLPPGLGESFLLGQLPKNPPKSGPVRFLELPDPGVLTDIDEPQDYALALEREQTPEEDDLSYNLTPWPTPMELWALLELVRPGPWVQWHCLSVARGALRLGLALKEVLGPAVATPAKGFFGGLIHDVDRREKKHEAKAAARLMALGWPKLGRIVGQHKDPTWPPTNDWDPTDLNAALAVYLADKYYLETNFVSLKERFGSKIDFFTDLKAKDKALARLTLAQEVAAFFLERIKRDPATVVAQRTDHQLEVFADQLEKEISPF
jgi:CTP:molybdopterin cytidylyltransferase MocA